MLYFIEKYLLWSFSVESRENGVKNLGGLRTLGRYVGEYSLWRYLGQETAKGSFSVFESSCHLLLPV